MTPELMGLCAAVMVVAALYASVGHAGASGYIAVMSLAGTAALVIRPTSLTLNVAVASIAAVQFARAGHFDWRLFWPFALPAVPLAFLAGTVQLPLSAFKVLLGIVLLFSAAYFFWKPHARPVVVPPKRWLAAVVGGLIGVLSGLTGTGGGIFLTPLLLVFGWAAPKPAAAVSAAFILSNSLAGLAGFVVGSGRTPDVAWQLLVAVAIGGAVGSQLGATRLAAATIKRLLALVLVIAGGKLLLG